MLTVEEQKWEHSRRWRNERKKQDAKEKYSKPDQKTRRDYVIYREKEVGKKIQSETQL